MLRASCSTAADPSTILANMQVSSLSAPVVSATDTSAPRSPQDKGTHPFNAVLRQEVDGREKSSVQAAASKPDKGSSSAGKSDKAATLAKSEPAEASQRNAADDASDIEAGIASLSLELAAMVTNLLQLHGKAAPADKGKKAAAEDASDSGNSKLDTVDVGILGAAGMATAALANDTKARPLKSDSSDLSEPATKKTTKNETGGSKTKAADLGAATAMTAKAGADVIQPVRASVTADASAQFATTLQAVNLSLPALAASSALPVGAPVMSPPVGSTAWDQALAQRVTWMVNGTQQSATLTLNPPELGPLQIVLNLTPTHADASFIASQPEVRQALEAALPKLRDMLGEAGIELGQASVSSGSPDASGQFRQNAQPGKRSLHASLHATAEATPSLAITSPLAGGSAGLGLIDTFV